MRSEIEEQLMGNLVVEGRRVPFSGLRKVTLAVKLDGLRRTRVKRAREFGRLLHWYWKEQMVTLTSVMVVGFPRIDQVHGSA